jgi:hypothetical protein
MVHRVDRDLAIPDPSARDIARLFWLILKAQGVDPGPDVSLAAATGERPKGEDLTARLRGKILSFGAKASVGPLTLRLEPDGQLTYLHWNRAFGPETGTWKVEGDQLCFLRDQRRCYTPVVNGERIALFDQYGVMQIDAVAMSQ